MPIYRAYRVDRRKHIRAAAWIEAKDDARAKVEAKQQLCEEGAPVVELWHANRLVDEIDCDDDPED